MLAAQITCIAQTAGVRDHLDLLVHVPAIGCHARSLVSNDQAALQSRVVRRDTSRAGIGVAAQGLYAAQSEHETACRIHEIGAGCQRPRDAGRCHQLPGGDHPDPFPQAADNQRIDDHRQRFVDRQRHVIRQCLRCRAAAAFSAIDGQKVGRRLQPPSRNRCRKLIHETAAADCGFDAHRFPGHLANMLYSVEQIVDAGDIRMAVRAKGITAHSNAANLGDLGRHLVARKDPPLARLGSLRQLDLESANRLVLGQYA